MKHLSIDPDFSPDKLEKPVDDVTSEDLNSNLQPQSPSMSSLSLFDGLAISDQAKQTMQTDDQLLSSYLLGNSVKEENVSDTFCNIRARVVQDKASHHAAWHASRLGVLCPRPGCREYKPTKEEVKRHIKLDHEDDLWVCRVYRVRYETMAECERHFTANHDGKGIAPMHLVNKNRVTAEEVLTMWLENEKKINFPFADSGTDDSRRRSGKNPDMAIVRNWKNRFAVGGLDSRGTGLSKLHNPKHLVLTWLH